MTTTPVPPAAIDAAAPTSRSTFRLLAKAIGATNRDADNLRHALLTAWEPEGGVGVLTSRLQALDADDPSGAQGVEARLAVWFSPVSPGDGALAAHDAAVLGGLTPELVTTLVTPASPAE